MMQSTPTPKAMPTVKTPRPIMLSGYECTDLDRAEQAEAQDHHKESDVVPRPRDEVHEVGQVVQITVDLCPVDHAGDDTCRREQLS